MPYRAVIYDIDGTVLNTLNMNIYPLMRIIEEETGEAWTFEQVLRFASCPGMKVMEALGVADPEGTYARWVRYVNEYEDEDEEGAILYEGFDEVFAELSARGVTQAVVSAKTRAQYEIDAVSRSIDRYMETVMLADNTDRHKPDPTPLLIYLERLGIEPSEAIYIGDACSDYEAARNAHMAFGYATWGSTSSEDSRSRMLSSTPPRTSYKRSSSLRRILDRRILGSNRYTPSSKVPRGAAHRSGSAASAMRLRSARLAKSPESQMADSPCPSTSGMRLCTGATAALGPVVTVERRPPSVTPASKKARAPGRRKRYWRRTGLPVRSLGTRSVVYPS